MKVISRENISQYIGSIQEPTEWFEVSQEQINQFADSTHDHQFIHVDPVRAKDSPFGSTIAHGFLTLSLLGYFVEQFGLKIEGQQMLVNYGFDKVRFLAPVRVGKRIRAVATYSDIVEKKPGQYVLTMSVSIEIEGEEKPALMADWILVQFVK